MERVTKRGNRGHYYMTGDGIFSDWGVPEKFIGDDIDYIGAIEDILGDTYNLDRLRELAEADKDGRCVVLPKCENTVSAIKAAEEIDFASQVHIPRDQWQDAAEVME